MPRKKYDNFDSAGLKACSICNARLPKDLFTKDARSPDGAGARCNKCKLAAVRAKAGIYSPFGAETKLCTKCNKDLPIGMFHANKYSKYGLSSRCKQCRCSDSKAWIAANKSSVADTGWKRKIRTKYGLSTADYYLLLLRQNNRCAICNDKCLNRKHFDVDHDHATGRIRGLLCRNCNNAVGLFHNAGVVMSAGLYLCSLPPQDLSHLDITSSLNCISAAKKARLKYRYGISSKRYAELFVFQGGLCAICFRQNTAKRSLCVDHSHGTGQIRGLLCTECNASLGKIRDNKQVIANLWGYLSTNCAIPVTMLDNNSCRQLTA